MECSFLVFWVWRYPIYESRVSLPFHSHGHMATAEGIKGACALALVVSLVHMGQVGALEEETFLALVTYQYFKNTKNYQPLIPSFDPSLAPKF